MILRFNPDKHFYELAIDDLEFVAIPSVTTILGRFFPVWAADAARDRGTDIHNAIELIEAGNLDEASIADDIAPYLAAYSVFRSEHMDWQIADTEIIVAHPGLQFAGAIDAVFRTPKGLAVVDYKSGLPMLSHSLQTAAYRLALKEWAGFVSPGERIDRFCVYLKDDGTYDIREHYHHEADSRAFSQLRDVYAWTERTP